MYRKQTAGGYPGPGAGKDNLQNVEISPAFAELEQGVYAALETYSNVHRGSGHKSMVSEHLLDKARDIVLEHFGFRKGKYVVIFCTARRAEILKTLVKPGSFQIISSRETGLPLGVTAFAVRKKALPQGKPFQTGGGTTRLVSADRVIWGGIPEKFEGGTPSLINIIAFAKAIQLIKKFGSNAFRVDPACKTSATEILYSDELQNLSGRDLINELRNRIIGRDILVPTIYGDEHYINLDNAASTPTFTTVWDAVRKTWRLPIQVRNEIVQEVSRRASPGGED